MDISKGASTGIVLTKFPYLGSSANNLSAKSPDEFYERNFDIPQDSPALSEEKLTLVWAHLLKYYGTNDVVFFKVNGITVKVDFELNSVENIADDSDVGSQDGTAVFIASHLQSFEISELNEYNTSLSFDDSGDNLCLRISTRLVPEDHVDNIVLQIQCLLLEELSSISANMAFGRYQGARSVLNPTPCKLSGKRFLHQVLENEDSPFGVSLEFLDADYSISSFSYRELDLLSTKMACQILETLGEYAANHRAIPVLLPKSPQLYMALFAILKSGKAFCPIPLDAPLERMLYICRDVNAPFLITTTELGQQIEAEPTSPPLFHVSNEHLVIDQSQATKKELPLCDDKDLAYVMYTSGSTGVPKGVSISHAAIMQSLHAHQKHIARFERFLQFANPTFDVFVFEFFFPLLRGATVVAVDRGLLLNNLPEVIVKSNVDALELTPTVLQTVILENKDALKNVKCLLTIGEMLTETIVKELGYDENGTGGILQGMYGPTEAAVHCSIAPNVPRNGRPADIGIPLDTVSSFIVSPLKKGDDPKVDCEILPLGFTGELALGGHQLADEYLDRPKETASAFVTHSEYGPLYRTGDRGRFLSDGRIEILGRLNAGQVKLRGMRVELGEIEATIRKADGVHACVASVLRNGSQLVVFVSGDKQVTTETVRQICEKWLPAPWRPHHVKIFEKIPKLASGKADRKRLEREWEMEDQELANNDQDSATSQSQVRTALKSVIGVSRTTMDNDSLLRHIGLDSIGAIKMAQLLRKAGGDVQVSQLMQPDMTVGVLEELFQRNKDRKMESSRQKLVDEEFASIRAKCFESLSAKLDNEDLNMILDVLPCTKIQAGMLAETCRDPTAYCNWVLLSVENEKSVEAVCRAIRGVVDSNEILRTGFVRTDSELGFAQLVWKEMRATQLHVNGEVKKQFSYDVEKEMDPPVQFQVCSTDEKIQISVLIHHALYDGWSLENIIDDIASAVEGKDIKKRPQYREVVWYFTASKLETESLESTLSFWQDHLEKSDPCQFPNLHSRTEISSGTGRESILLEKPSADYISAAHQLGVSAQTIAQAAWAYLLSQYTGSQDVIFGTVLSGRTLPINDIDQIIGPCLTTLPARAKLPAGRSLQEIAQDLHQHNISVLENAEVSLRDIKQSCMSDLSRPIFDTIIVWQHTGQEQSSSVLTVDSEDSLEYAITIEVEPKNSMLEIRLTYLEERLPESQAKLVLKQLSAIIDNFVGCSLSNEPFSFNNVDEAALSIENPHPKSFWCDNSLQSLVSLVEANVDAEKTDDPPAIEFCNGFNGQEANLVTMSYDALNTQANKLARHLLSVRSSNTAGLIAVCMEKSLLCYVSILAILKTGAGYLPLTPETPKERLRQILDAAGVEILLTTNKVSQEISTSLSKDINVISVDHLDLSSFSPLNLNIHIEASDVAYVIFTSGSTGTPKGVMVTHGNIVSNIKVLSEMYPRESNSKLLQFCSVAFDVSVFEIFFTWASKMTLCSGTKDTLLSDLEGVIRSMGVTHLSLTNTVAALINPDNVPSVHFLVMAGEKLTEKVYRTWANRGFYQGYGPSETTNICTVNPDMNTSYIINNIGRPFVNTSAFAIDQNDKEFRILPKGCVGELCFGGDQVFKGYMNSPELTSAKIIDDPQYGRIYRTGDIGRILSDGTIAFISRIDDQVKLRGQRIELGEINAALMLSHEVNNAITLVMDIEIDGANVPSIVSFVTLPGKSDAQSAESMFCSVKAGTEVVVQSLHDSLSGRLPHYMLPSFIVPLNSIPMTNNSKIDERKLKDVFAQLDSEARHCCIRSTASGDSEHNDWTDFERDVAETIASLAHVSVSQISRSSSIYEFGLDSIKAIELSRRLSNLGHSALKVSQIMQHPTPAALAVILQQHDGKPSEQVVASELDIFASESVVSEATKELAINGSRVARVLPCTPLQEAMLSAKSLQGAAAYANHTVLRLKIDPQQVKCALEKLVESQEILRSCFTTSSVPNHPFLQLVLKEHNLPWMSFTIDEGQKIMDAIHKYMETLELEPLSSDPPYSFALFENGDEKYLVVSMHHCLYDGYSMNLFWGDLEAICEERELDPREPFSSFLNYMLSLDMDRSLSFWAEYLKGYTAHPFHSLTPVNLAGRANSNRMLAVKKTSALSLGSIERACNGLSISLLACCQATWAKLLSSYVSQMDVCFGNVVSGRTVPVEGVETILGPCFNTIPVRTTIASGETNRSLFRKLHRSNIMAGSHQLTPLRKLTAMESLDLKGGSLFDTLLLLQPAYERDSAALWNIVEEHGAMDVPITIELTPNKESDRLDIVLHFNNQLVSEESAHTMCQQFLSVLEVSLNRPDENVFNFSGATEIISTSSDQSNDEIALETLESMLELPAKDYPQNDAVEYLSDANNSSKLTFEKLHQQSNRLAHLLLSKNLDSDAVIGISHNLGQIEHLVCILACLKAGHGLLLDANKDDFKSLQGFSPALVISNAAITGVQNTLVVNNHLESLLDDVSFEDLDRHIASDSPAVYYKRTGSSTPLYISFRELAETLQTSKEILQFNADTRFLCTTGFDIFYFLLSWISGSCLCLTSPSDKLQVCDSKKSIEILKGTSVKAPLQVLSDLQPEMVPTVNQFLCEVDWMPESIIAPWIGKLWKVYTGFDGLPWSIGKTQAMDASNLLGGLIADARVEMAFSNNGAPTLALGRLVKHGDKSVDGIAARVFSDGRIQLVDCDLTRPNDHQFSFGDINDACLAACSQLGFAWSGFIHHQAASEDVLAVFVSFSSPSQFTQIEGAWDAEDWPSIEHNLQIVLRRFAHYPSKKIIVPVRTLPLDAKVMLDRGAIIDFFQNLDLKDVYQEDTLGDADHQDLERTIAAAFSEVSQVPAEKIRSDSTIYELGLDSITTSQVAMFLRRNGLEVTVIDILENPSVRKLSRHMNTKDAESTSKHSGAGDSFAEYQQKVLNESGLENEADKIQFIVPCTTTQEGMLSEFLRSTDGAYFNHVLYEVDKDVDITKLVSAWTEVVASTEMLRTSFFHLDDLKHPFAMIVRAEGSTPVPIHVADLANDDQTRAYMEKETKSLESDFRNNMMQSPWKIVFFRGAENPRFLFSSHHVLYDAHSLELLMQDVAHIYNGRNPDQRPSILPLVTSILRGSTDTKALQTSRLYWDEQLASVKVGKFPVLGTIRSPHESIVSRSRSVSMSLTEIEGSCKELGISLHALGQASWARILGSYMGEDNVAFGLVLSGRQGFSTAEDTIFPCLATLPSVANLSGSNLDLVRSIQRRTADTMRYQHTPLKLIQSWRGQPDQALFDTIFLFQKSSKPAESDVSWHVLSEDVSINYAVTVEMEISEDRELLFRVNSRLSVLPTEQSDILLGQLEACLISIIQSPHAPSSDFTTISPELLSHTPPKEEVISCDVELVHEFVERQARLTPNKVALEFVSALTEQGATKESWTYSRLNDEATRIANYLLSKNVQVDDIVAVCLDKCAAASVLFNGILKAGCGFLCLDYNSPVDRKALILSDSGAKLIFTDAVKATDLDGHVSVPVVEIENFFDAIKSQPTELQYKPEITPDSLCYCLYTSGTTGTPKGCEITHKNTVQAMLAFQRLFAGHWDENSRFLQFASFHFDVSVLEQFWSWSVGVCVTSAPRDLVFQDLTATIRNLEITHLDLTPSLAALLNPEDCPSLCKGVFITGGEKLRRDILDKWGEKGCLYNGYGPTEVTIGCTMYPRVPITADPSNIGPQFDNVGSFVLRAGTEKVVPRGSVGELCAYGPLVGRGYLNREALTKERFPTLKEFNIRIYRTGDLVRVLHDGSFQFLGRADDQVKLRGQRLEISEINHTIKAADDKVKDVATLVLKHPKQHREQLVAFLACEVHHKDHKKRAPALVNAPENKILKDNVMHHCRSKLPPYMVPTHFLFLTHLPLSPNNKVDNKVLKAFYDNISLQDLNATDGPGAEGKWSAVEQSLREILCQMANSNLADISKSSSIFEMGLDSVSVITFAKRLRGNGFEVASPALIMQNPSIQLLSKVLRKDEPQMVHNAREGELLIKSFSQRHAFQIKRHCKFQSSNIEEILPCSPLQEGMLTRSLASDGELYFNTFTLQLSPDTDLDRLERAWEVLIAKTKVLRTCFVQTSNGFAQVVLKNFAPVWSDSFEGKDWSISPPLSFMVRKSSGIVNLSVRIFHALYDGNSLSLILDEVANIYHGKDPATHLQFSEALPSILSLDKVAAKAFWATHLSAKGQKPFPTLCDDPEDGYHTIEHQLTSYSEIVKHSRRYKCTPLAIFQAAWAAILAKYIGRAVTFGLVVSGRALPIDGIDGCIGPLFNTIPCRMDVKEGDALSDLVHQAHKFNCDSMPFQHTPLRDIHKLLGVEPGKTLFDTLLVFQYSSAQDFNNFPWTSVGSESTPDFPIALEINHSGGDTCTLTFVAQNSVLDRDLSLELVGEFETMVQSILKDDRQSCTSLIHTASDSGYHSPMTESSSPHLDATRGTFTWTKEAEIIRDVLQHGFDIIEDSIHEDDSLFQLGLDSIDMVNLSAKLRAKGIVFSVSELMKNATIRQMVGRLREKSRQSSTTAETKKSIELDDFEKSLMSDLKAKGVDIDNIQAVLPTTPLQEAMIAMCISSGNSLYFNSELLELDEHIDLAKLREAWNDVVSTNPILRTKFLSLPSVGIHSKRDFVQIVQRDAAVPWDEYHCLDADIMQYSDKLAKQHRNNIDAQKQTPMIVSVVKSESKTILLLSISHALYDGYSLSLFFSDLLSAYYNADSEHRRSYRDYLQKMLLADQENSVQFWADQLQSSPSTKFPRMTKMEKDDAHTRTERLEHVSTVRSSDFKGFCRQSGITEQVLGQTCWGLVLAQIHGQPDVAFGTVLACRDGEEEQNIMFPTMNTLPVRMIVHGTFRDLLRDIQENAANAMDHKFTALRDIQRVLKTGNGALFDTMFVYQKSTKADSSTVQPLWKSIDNTADLEFAVAVEMEIVDSEITWRIAYGSLVDSDTAQAILTSLDNLLKQMIENPDMQSVSFDGNHYQFGGLPLFNSMRDDRLRYRDSLIGKNHIIDVIQNSTENIKACEVCVLNDRGIDVLVAFVAPISESEDKLPLLERLKVISSEALEHGSNPDYIVLTHDAETTHSTAGLQKIFNALSDEEKKSYSCQVASISNDPGLEQKIREAVAEVSSLPENSIDNQQTIFHLGLDSISAIQLASALRNRSVFLDVGQILREATVERMASAWKRLSSKKTQRPTSAPSVDIEKMMDQREIHDAIKKAAISRESIEKVTPASLGQTYLLSAWQNSGGRVFYPTFIFKASRPLDMHRLSNAWDSTAKKHALLRSTFVATRQNDIPIVQVILKNKSLASFGFADASASSETEANLIERHYDIEQTTSSRNKNRLARLFILRTERSTILFLTLHHALYDAVSLPILLSDIQSYYAGDLEETVTADCYIPYLDHIFSRDSVNAKEFWTSYFANQSPTLMIQESDRAVVSHSPVQASCFESGAIENASAIEKYSQAKGLSIHSVFLASYGKTLAGILGKQDVIFGVYVANRHLSDASRGWEALAMPWPTLNFVPLLLKGAASLNVDELARSIQDDLVKINSEEFGHVGLWQIKEWTGIEVDCFFNFVMPQAQPGKRKVENTGGFAIEEVVLKRDNTNTMEDAIEVDGLFANSEFLEHNTARASARTHLDVEMAIRMNAVDIGVFASGVSSTVSQQVAELSNGICRILKSLGVEAKQ